MKSFFSRFESLQYFELQSSCNTYNMNEEHSRPLAIAKKCRRSYIFLAIETRISISDFIEPDVPQYILSLPKFVAGEPDTGTVANKA